MLQAVELPAGVANLTAGLPDVDADALTLKYFHILTSDENKAESKYENVITNSRNLVINDKVGHDTTIFHINLFLSYKILINHYGQCSD